MTPDWRDLEKLCVTLARRLQDRLGHHIRFGELEPAALAEQVDAACLALIAGPEAEPSAPLREAGDWALTRLVAAALSARTLADHGETWPRFWTLSNMAQRFLLPDWYAQWKALWPQSRPEEVRPLLE